MRARVAIAIGLIYITTASAGSGRAAPKGEEHLAARIDYLLDRIASIVVRPDRPEHLRARPERMLVAPVVSPEGGRVLRPVR